MPEVEFDFDAMDRIEAAQEQKEKAEAVPEAGHMNGSATTNGMEVWEVVGGGDKGGIIVRKEMQTTSQEVTPRLATGAMIKSLELVGDRMRYQLITGIGPQTGWVSLKFKDKVLLEKAASKQVPEPKAAAPEPKAAKPSQPDKAPTPAPATKSAPAAAPVPKAPEPAKMAPPTKAPEPAKKEPVKKPPVPAKPPEPVKAPEPDAKAPEPVKVKPPEPVVKAPPPPVAKAPEPAQPVARAAEPAPPSKPVEPAKAPPSKPPSKGIVYVEPPPGCPPVDIVKADYQRQVSEQAEERAKAESLQTKTKLLYAVGTTALAVAAGLSLWRLRRK